MANLTLSSDFRVTIPKSIRERLGLVRGQRLAVFAYGDRIELIPVKPASELRGFLRGMDTRVERDRCRIS